MTLSPKKHTNVFIFIGLVLSALAVSACDLLEQPSSTVVSDPTVIVPTPVNTPEPSQNESVVAPSDETGTRDSTRALTVWVLPELEIDNETQAGAVMAAQVAAFEEIHPDIELTIEHKAIIGQGSMLDYFSAAPGVAPNVLPDLILISHDTLPRFVNEGLVYPLDELISEEDIADLYPIADELTVFESGRMGYPHSLSGLTHAAYNTTIYSSTLPSRVEQLLELPLKPAFPAAGKEGAELLFQLYLDEGGQLYDLDGNIAFESTPLLVGLRRIQALRSNGNISSDVGDIASHDEMWLAYKSGSSSLILTQSNRFLAEYPDSAELGFDQFPGSIRGLTPLMDGWVWSVTTADPVQQALATELLTWLANGPNMGDTTLATQRLPARATALERWPQDDPYTDFLNDELNRAIMRPVILDSNIGSILQEALQSLFATDSPQVQQISDSAVSAINEN